MLGLSRQAQQNQQDGFGQGQAFRYGFLRHVVWRHICIGVGLCQAKIKLRVVCFLTAGYLGNDLEIIGEVQKHPNARVFAYGVGNSVNRFLIESMAKAGRGDSEVVTLNDKADAEAHRLYQRLRSPVLTDVSIDWRDLPVADVLPRKLPDLFSGKPLVVTRRYTAAATGSIVIHGKRAGEDFEREIPIHLNSSATTNGILSTFWARRKIDDLMSQDWSGLQTGNVKPAVQNEITQLGLSYKLMMQFTSFVAIEERVVTTNGKPTRVEVPVEMPEGVSYEGIFGNGNDAFTEGFWARSTQGGMARSVHGAVMYKKALAPSVATPIERLGSGSGGGVGASVGGPVLSAPPPTPPQKQELSKSNQKSLDEDVAYIITDKERAAFSVPKTLPEVVQPSPTPDIKSTADRALLESKLSPAVLERFDCWKKQASDCKLAPDGTGDLQLFLNENSAALIEQLKAIGLQISQIRKQERLVIARVPLDKLTDLAKLQQIKFISEPRR